MIAQNQNQNQHVIFSLFGQLFSISASEVVEIIRLHSITPIPGTPGYIAGVINLRGNIIPVVRLSGKFEIVDSNINANGRIIIVDSKGEHIGLIVDDVRKVAAIDPQQFDSSEMPGFLRKDYFKGFTKEDEGIIGILDLEAIIETA